MKTRTKLKIAWKRRRQIWKYRWALRHRREIAGWSLAAAAIAAGIFLARPRIESPGANRG